VTHLRASRRSSNPPLLADEGAEKVPKAPREISIVLITVCNHLCIWNEKHALNLFQVNGPELGLPNGIDTEVPHMTAGVNELTFEEDEEDQFYMKDLPRHACSYVS